ncbi:hypothetical protein MHYP_G00197920 [Metynnis hypsauchen]
MRGVASPSSASDWPAGACDATALPADREEKPVRGELEERLGEETLHTPGERLTKLRAMRCLTDLMARQCEL